MIDNKKIVMDIQDTDITVDLIEKLLDIHTPIVSNRFKILDNYYKGKHDILNRQIADKDKPNNKPITNFCSYITDTLTGFFVGKPVSYYSNNKEYLNILTEIFELNDEQAKNHDLAHKASIKGQSFELVYLDEDGLINFDTLDTDSVIMVYDSTVKNNVNMAIRYYTIHNYLNNTDTINIDVYTKTNIYHYVKEDKNITFINTEEHYFKEVPIVEYSNNRYRMSDFEQIITLNDMYNKNIADIANDIEYFSNAYLALSQAEGTNGDDIKAINQNRVIILPNGGDAKFLTKQLNDAVVNNHRNNLSDDIHKVSYVPDLSKEINANVSGTALKTKMFTTTDILVSKERKFKKAIQKRIRLITNILNLKGNDFDPNDIKINFHYNLPSELFGDADSISKMGTILSQRTMLQNIGIEDIDEEIEQIKKEQESTFDLDTIQDTELKINSNGYAEHKHSGDSDE
ncbi:phage portal protein, SPP1 family [Hathewaya proteolytica DSM 3090]|uniref:Phage portal protein, SPP1 family n=1 Tax=Hathewaya proteolytica DSM 3090 TaxID=1121331 RepID=A0A1M6L1M7_9CLOT|nr:phage portal protein [Hathewaya proteolytica]SHJ65049.1 phage portal protein, SPP1 family [Hathewaya proteolytica DSM 3090]